MRYMMMAFFPEKHGGFAVLFLTHEFQHPLTDRLGWNRLRFPTEKGQK